MNIHKFMYLLHFIDLVIKIFLKLPNNKIDENLKCKKNKFNFKKYKISFKHVEIMLFIPKIIF